MRPRVIIHNAVGVDGTLSGFDIDVGLYYRLAGELGCDATLVGSGTILAAPEALAEDDPEQVATAQPKAGSLIAVPDSLGRIRCWGALRASGLWKRFVSLACASTPVEHREYLRRRGIGVIEAGDDRVDLAAALDELGRRYGVGCVRVDSGGSLNGALLRSGLVDEVSLLLEPQVSASGGVPFVRGAEGDSVVVPLRLKHVQSFDGGEVWLRWDVLRTGHDPV